MNAMTMARALFGEDPDPARSQAVATATTEITSLLRCVVWLLQQRIEVTGFRGWNGIGGDHLLVTVAPSPKLRALFSGECDYQRRVHDGGGQTLTWCAEKFGVRIEWPERIGG